MPPRLQTTIDDRGVPRPVPMPDWLTGGSYNQRTLELQRWRDAVYRAGRRRFVRRHTRVLFYPLVWCGQALQWFTSLQPELWGALLGHNQAGFFYGVAASLQRLGGRNEQTQHLQYAACQLCLSCGYDFVAAPIQGDGCIVCPECGAAWRVEQRTSAAQSNGLIDPAPTIPPNVSGPH